MPAGAASSTSDADEGSTVTYTLTYTVGSRDVTDGVIIDELPDGVTYVVGSASSDTQFTFKDFDITNAGALTWTADSVTEGGTLTYKVKIDTGASKLAQPLSNVATIDSEETEPDSDTSRRLRPGHSVGGDRSADRRPRHARGAERARLQPAAHPRGPRWDRPGHRLRDPGPGRGPTPEPPLGTSPGRSSRSPRGVGRPVGNPASPI